MDHGMIAQEEKVDKEYNNACNNLAQVHLVQQTAMSNMPNTST